MSHGYQPQTSDISTKLYWTFFWGIVLGTALGYGIRGIVDGGDAPVGEQVAVTPQAEEVQGSSELAATPAPIVPAPDPVAETLPSGPFDADVDGLWPARHVFVGISGTKASLETLEWLNEFKPGGIVLGPENIKDPLQFGALVLQLKQAVGLGTKIDDPPFLVYRDDTRNFPAVAAALEMATGDLTADPKGDARAQARAARTHGIGVFIAPSLDLYLAGVSAPSLQQITLGSQPNPVAQRGLDYIQQLEAGGIIAVATHFPGAGLAVAGSDGVWRIPAEQMDGLAAGMGPFQEAIAAGIPGVLVGHMAVPGIETEDKNRPASSSEKLLQLLLREKLGFTGVIIAEDLDAEPTIGKQPLERIAVTALVNGCDAVILKDADREGLLEICSALVRLSRRKDFPSSQLISSKARLDAWEARLAAAPAPEKKPDDVVTKVVVANVEDVKETAGTAETKPEIPAAPDTSAEKPEATEPAAPAKAEEVPPATPEEAEVVTAVMVVPPGDDAKPEKDVPASVPADDAKPAETSGAKSAETLPEATAENPETAPLPAEEAGDEAAMPIDDDTVFEEHTIAKGDTLIELAKRYGVSVADLNAWNNLDSQTIKYGYTLKVRPLPNGDGKTNVVSSEKDVPVDNPGEDNAPEKDPAAEADGETSMEAPSVSPEAASSPEPILETAALESAAEPTPAPMAETEGGAAAPSIGEGVETQDGPAPSEPVESPVGDALLTGATPEEAPVEPAKPAKPQPPNTDKREHTVKAGDTAESVANNYGVSTSDLAEWNGLADEKAPLTTGRTLVVYLPMAAAEEEESEDSTASRGDEPVVPGPAADPVTYEIHVVVAGDNLRRIAQKYGVTQQAIIDLNKIKSPDHVQLGWKLKIPK